MKQEKTLMRMKKIISSVTLCAVLLGLWIMHVDVSADSNVSTDKDNPLPISIGEEEQEFKGPADMQGYVYYTFTLDEDATVTGSIDGLRACDLYLCDDNTYDTSFERVYDANFEWKLPAGSYVFRGGPRGKGEYSLKLKSTPYNWGTVNVEWGASLPCSVDEKLPYTITLTGGEPGVEIDGTQASSGRSNDTSSNDDKTTVEGYITGGEAGDHTLTVSLYETDRGYKQVKFDYSLKPGPPSYGVAVKNNAATVKVSTENCYVEFYKDGKWTTYKASDYKNNVTIKGLKDNTKYKVRVYAIEKGYKGEPSVFDVYTKYKVKPVIESVKVSNVKATKVSKYWKSGYFDGGGNWHGGYWIPAHTNTTYKMTITLKNMPKGATAYVESNGQNYSTKSKKITIYGSYTGKPGEKMKVSITYGRANGFCERTKATVKNVTIK